ncbi:zinc-binding alcohol dehydrogenase [Microbacterium sp. BWT-B31]|uniref:zinc-dependent alcohol dehydrogenase n=1 Tax=Microbacterium sp. BWT-B31 TaxID=3232072 RepID=UPI0035282B4E
MIDARAIAFVEKGEIALVDITVPEPGPSDVAVETELTAVSQGTDRAMVLGTYNGIEDRYPLIYGYSRVGRVTAVGGDVTGLAVGDRVFVGMGGTKLDPSGGFGPSGGGYTSVGVVDASDAVKLPETIDSASAAVGALGAIAYQGVARSEVRAGSRVLVVGLGAIGQFSALFSALAGAQVWVADPVTERLNLASRLSGATPVDVTKPLAEQIEQTAWGYRPWPGRNDRPTSSYEKTRWSDAHGVVDVVIDATGRPDAFEAYVPLLVREGTLCLQGYYTVPLTLDFHAAHMKRLTIHCPGGMDLFDYETVVRLLSTVDVSPLIGLEIPIAEVPEAVERLLLAGPAEVVSAVIRWSGGTS